MKHTLLSCAFCAAIMTSSVILAEHESHDAEANSDKIITPNAMPVVHHGFDIFITADFIYWTARVDNLEYSHTGNTFTSDNTSSFTGVSRRGAYQGVDHKLSPGFKAGIGFGLGHDGWDTYFGYTWLHNSASNNSSHTGRSAQSLWDFAPGSAFDVASSSIGSSSALWQLRFNSVDWELGRNYFISPHLLLRPFIGLKGAWNKQTYSIHHQNIVDLEETTPGTFTTRTTGSYDIYNKQRFWGIGARAGLNSSFQFSRNWSLFGDWSLAALWSYFNVTRTDQSQEVSGYSYERTSTTPIVVTNESRKMHSIQPVLELDIGLRWDYWFLDDDYRIRIQMAWEEQVWFDQNQFIDSNSRYGSLTLQGLTVAFRLDF